PGHHDRGLGVGAELERLLVAPDQGEGSVQLRSHALERVASRLWSAATIHTDAVLRGARAVAIGPGQARGGGPPYGSRPLAGVGCGREGQALPRIRFSLVPQTGQMP